jgi:hypothetical protein
MAQEYIKSPKLGYVNVGLANILSMLNNEHFIRSFWGDFEFYPKCVYVSVRKHFFVRFGLNMEHD